jgi:hypothetical protein
VQAARHYSEHFALPVESRRSADSSQASGSILLIREQIRALQARLDRLALSVSEAERLRTTLEALRAIKLD